MNRRRGWLAAVWLLTLGGCARPPGPPLAPQERLWTGRLALQVQSDPPQAYFAGFELRGSAQAGELALTSPLGNTLATLVWSPGSARMHSGGSERLYDSIETLTTELTGAPLPIHALFDWLDGTLGTINGWQADLTQLPEGRLLARRLEPAPAAELRLVIDQ